MGVKPNDIRIGDLVAYRIGEKDLSTPMTVVGIFSCKSDLDKATVYLDFEWNEKSAGSALCTFERVYFDETLRHTFTKRLMVIKYQSSSTEGSVYSDFTK